MDLPAPFLARMEKLLGEAYPAFAAGYALAPYSGLRVNTLKVSSTSFLGFSPFHLQRIPWTQDGFLVDRENSFPGKHPYHAAGLYYLQEPSAMAVVEALAPQPHEKVLDLAAAPGGKTTHLAARMHNSGLLVANEIHPRRVWDLAENLERWGISNAVVTNETPENLAAHFESFFDRVIVDAPCSGEGLFRKTPSAAAEWSEALVQSCSVRQTAILEQAAKMVRPGGWLVYSTCTFAPQENEAVVARLLLDAWKRESYRYELASLAHIPGLDPSHPDWVNPSLANPDYKLERAGRIWPHRNPGEGHFIALLKRIDTGSSAFSQGPPDKHAPQNDRENQAIRYYRDFSQETLLAEPFRGSLEIVGSYLYRTPLPMSSLRGLKVIHPGLWLGTIKKDRFEPSHALAMALRANLAHRTLSMEPENPWCAAYLRGETLPGSMVEGAGNGWTLACFKVPGEDILFPLGWCRRVGEQTKNAYPKGLRRIY
jgi:NOL1/NOP2/sun family putative RNA methylase